MEMLGEHRSDQSKQTPDTDLQVWHGLESLTCGAAIARSVAHITKVYTENQ